MDYVKEYRSFINSYYLNEGVRVTVGLLSPVLLMSIFGTLETGITIALGAMAVSITDNPGPIHHRRNAMMACAAIVFFVCIITGFTSGIPWLFIIILAIFCFFFSMIGVYGARVTSIGLAALLVMVLQTQHQSKGAETIYNALYLLSGSCWYILLSLALYQIRPYKLIQQALGEYVMAAANYLRAKGSFYDPGSDYDKNYRELLHNQIYVQERQNLIAELLFKTRNIVKESTNTSRVLMMVFLDITDLFERAMTAHQDYKKLHDYFDASGVMAHYRSLIYMLSDELDEVGIALKSGRASKYNTDIDTKIMEERQQLQQLRLSTMDSTNIEGFISLRHILDSIEDIASRIRTLHQYTSSETRVKKKSMKDLDPSDFVTKQPIDPKVLIDNFSFRSNIFRHSIRITIAAMCAWLIGLFFPVGHSYWILLTVIVILKPGFALTKTRNFERLTGTLIGAALGATLLSFVKNNDVILVLLVVSMIGAYSFLRKKYFVSVILMTLYLLLMFHLLQPHDFKTILTDRIIDTIIGSAIAFVFSNILSPLWEHEQIDELMVRVLQDNKAYFESVANTFTGHVSDTADTKLKRKDSWVSLANLSDAFNRMLSEPKSKQKNIQQIHQFVVSNHMLTSHIATLAYYTDNLEPDYITQDYRPLITASSSYLENSIYFLEETKTAVTQKTEEENGQVSLLDKRINDLMLTRRKEVEEGKLETSTRKFLSQFKSITDQFYFIYKTSLDIQKISTNLKSKPVKPVSLQYETI